MVCWLTSNQSQLHGVCSQLAHYLRSDISERHEFPGKIFKLSARLTQSGFRHDGVVLCNRRFLPAPMGWKRIEVRSRGCTTSGFGRSISDRSVSEVIDLIECRAKRSSSDFQRGDLLLERIYFALGRLAEHRNLIATRPQLGLQFASFAIKGRTQPI